MMSSPAQPPDAQLPHAETSRVAVAAATWKEAAQQCPYNPSVAAHLENLRSHVERLKSFTSAFGGLKLKLATLGHPFKEVNTTEARDQILKIGKQISDLSTHAHNPSALYELRNGRPPNLFKKVALLLPVFRKQLSQESSSLSRNLATEAESAISKFQSTAIHHSELRIANARTSMEAARQRFSSALAGGNLPHDFVPDIVAAVRALRSARASLDEGEEIESQLPPLPSGIQPKKSRAIMDAKRTLVEAEHDLRSGVFHLIDELIRSPLLGTYMSAPLNFSGPTADLKAALRGNLEQELDREAFFEEISSIANTLIGQLPSEMQDEAARSVKLGFHCSRNQRDWFLEQ